MDSIRDVKRLPPVRPEFENASIAPGQAAEVAHRLPLIRRLGSLPWVRHTLVVLGLCALWEAYAWYADNPLIFPDVGDTLVSLWQASVSGPLLQRMVVSLHVLSLGYVIGVIAATLLTSFAVSFQTGRAILSTLTSIFMPLPSIALLPLALLWFGLGQASLVFVIVQAVLWPVALSTYTGFLAVPESQRMAGQNIGLRGPRFVRLILIPAAFPSILAGLKIGWAFAWRTDVAAELAFGATSNSGGLGWFIFEARNQLDTARVFAGLIVIIMIGLLVEHVIFRGIELRTVWRWGMQR
jgi:NitT/TauT family transport system permease protein